MNVVAVIVAAGRGARFGERPKQYAEISGVSVLVHATMPFEHSPAVQQIVWVVPPGDERRLEPPPSLHKISAIVAGGETRRDSVAAALALDLPSDVVLVHDAARPLVTGDLISRVLAATIEVGAAIPVVTARDTVKRVDGVKVVQTLDRAALRLVQTPQGFRTELLRRAHAQVRTEVTDDAELVERLGHPVAIVDGDETNLKLTTPSDLSICEALLRERHANDTA